MNANRIFVATLEECHAKGIGQPVTGSTDTETYHGRRDKGLGDHAHAPLGETIVAYIDAAIATMAKTPLLSTAFFVCERCYRRRPNSEERK